MNALSTITIMPSNGQQLTTYKLALKNEILSGEYDPLEVLKMLKFAEKAITDILKDADIEDCIYNEAMKYGKSFEKFGCQFSIKAVGVSYDYTTCGDPVHEKLTEEMDVLKAEIKKREDMLKTLPDDGMADPNTGAIIYPPARKGKDKVSIKI
jgi:ferritin-like protein